MEELRFLYERVLVLDIKVFRFINTGLHNDILAYMMKFLANDIFLAGVILAGIFIIIKKAGRRGKLNAAYALWTVIAVNLVSTYLLKPVFRRPRPVVELDNIYFLVNMKHYGYAFPSTHTAMATALAVCLWVDYAPARPALVLFTVFVGFFCVYTGGHYPTDVAAGFLLGFAAGRFSNMIRNFHAKKESQAK